jgi:DNA-binding response OmpR family regulator
MRLLVVEDDPRLSRLLGRLLTEDGHVVDLALNAESAEQWLATGGQAAMILDIGLPDRSGLEVLRGLRAGGSSLPVIILTARDTVGDRVAGLDAGADDYLVKPFSYAELAARIRAPGRRARGTGPPGAARVAGPIKLDERTRRVSVNTEAIDLTPRLFDLLDCLMRYQGQVLSRQRLLDIVWPVGSDRTLNVVDVHVHALRERLGPLGGAMILTEYGIGYRLREV